MTTKMEEYSARNRAIAKKVVTRCIIGAALALAATVGALYSFPKVERWSFNRAFYDRMNPVRDWREMVYSEKLTQKDFFDHPPYAGLFNIKMIQTYSELHQHIVTSCDFSTLKTHRCDLTDPAFKQPILEKLNLLEQQLIEYADERGYREVCYDKQTDEEIKFSVMDKQRTNTAEYAQFISGLECELVEK